MSNKNVSINIPVLARVEGEGALEIFIEKGIIKRLKLRIFEPPRFFEKFLEGKHFSEVPDIVARICGICPVAYQMSAVHAFESLFNVKDNAWVNAMRRLFYCGEWIESHALHIHLLAAPDFLGYSSAPEMAKDYPEEVKRGVQIQDLGNQIVRLLGGRSVHPVGVRVGGFHHAPGMDEVQILLDKLKAKLPDVKGLLPWIANIDFPQVEQNFTTVALQDSNKYPMIGSALQSNQGHNVSIDQYEKYFVESHEAHSTALFSLLEGKPYLVGPLARVNMNYHQLPSEIVAAIKATGISFPSNNVYHSMLARAIELWFTFLESIQILENYQEPDSPYVDVKPKAGIAYGCSEAPRGILWHRYKVDKDGFIQEACIIPPTSQNQAQIEEDLRVTLTKIGLDQPDDKIRLHAEQVIRNYDPCISCATHFLKLNVTRQ